MMSKNASDLLDEILKARNEYFRTKGECPYGIRMTRQTYDKIKKHFEEGPCYFNHEPDTFKTLYGMVIDIIEENEI